MSARRKKVPQMPQFGSERFVYAAAVQDIEGALQALEAGYEFNGRLETNIHARIGWATSCLKHALADLRSLPIDSVLKSKRP